MSLTELEIIAGFIRRATCPEEVFGRLTGTPKERALSLKHNFRKLAKALHPDAYQNDLKAITLAESMFKELERMRKEAEASLLSGNYGQRFSWKIPILVKGKYVIESALCAGNIADLHLVSMESSTKHSGYVLKIARNANDNDLLNAERVILEKLHDKFKKKGSKDWPQTVPKILESFILDDGRSRRRVNVMEHFDGFFNGAEIRKRLPNGVDGRTVAWMWKRLLILMEWIEKTGLIHGAILPPHVMFYPDNDGRTVRDVRKHSIRLIDWCYAIEAKSRTRLSAWVKDYEDFYAPEILAKRPLSGSTDLYMGAATMLFLCGGDPKKKICPKHIPDAISKSIISCMETDPKRRPQTGSYFERFDAILKQEFGAKKYHDFNLPN